MVKVLGRKDVECDRDDLRIGDLFTAPNDTKVYVYTGYTNQCVALGHRSTYYIRRDEVLTRYNITAKRKK